MELGKKVAIFDWEWGRNSAPRDSQTSKLESLSVYIKFHFDFLQPKHML